MREQKRACERREEKQENRAVGNDLRSHDITIAVPSALTGLTAGFGMEPGGPPSPLSPTSHLSSSSPFHHTLSRLLLGDLVQMFTNDAFLASLIGLCFPLKLSTSPYQHILLNLKM